MAAAALLLALLAGAGAPTFAVTASRPASRPVDIRGNMVLVDEVYLAALDLPTSVPPTADTARTVARQILTFLRRAGYSLATVQARPAGDRIEVTVDEGRLSRIVVRGRDVVTTVAVKLQIDLPFDVFNRPQLERLLQAYRDEGARVTYQLVPARVVEHKGPQINPLALMPGSAPLEQDGHYELHIDFTGFPERSRLGVVAGIDSDSIHAGGVLSGFSALRAHDRFELEAQVGANFFEDLHSQTDELHFSRALAGARWLAPDFPMAGLRFMLRVREDLLRRQRQDLRVNSYWWNLLEGSAGLSLVPWNGIELTAELGLQQRDLFAIDQLMDTEGIPPVEPSSDLLPFVALAGRLVFEPERLRLDRRHRIEFEARTFPVPSENSFWFGNVRYRKVFEFGWNDLWLRGAGGWVAGNYGIADAIPMRYLRGVFGHAFYVDRAAAVGLDYRLSLTRDLFKVGVFHEAAVYRQLQPPDPNGVVRAANSFGASFHALVLDVFQLDFFYAAGFTVEGEFDHGASLQLEKAF